MMLRLQKKMISKVWLWWGWWEISLKCFYLNKLIRTGEKYQTFQCSCRTLVLRFELDPFIFSCHSHIKNEKQQYSKWTKRCKSERLVLAKIRGTSTMEVYDLLFSESLKLRLKFGKNIRFSNLSYSPKCLPSTQTTLSQKNMILNMHIRYYDSGLLEKSSVSWTTGKPIVWVPISLTTEAPSSKVKFPFIAMALQGK